MDSLYKEQILEHYKDPRNEGELNDADISVHVDNPTCGDELTFQAVIDDGTIEEIKFTGSGCALSIASASLLTEKLQGADVETVKSIGEEDMFDLLGLDKDNVSPMRVKCVLLSRDAAQNMIDGDTQ